MSGAPGFVAIHSPFHLISFQISFGSPKGLRWHLHHRVHVEALCARSELLGRALS